VGIAARTPWQVGVERRWPSLLVLLGSQPLVWSVGALRVAGRYYVFLPEASADQLRVGEQLRLRKERGDASSTDSCGDASPRPGKSDVATLRILGLLGHECCSGCWLLTRRSTAVLRNAQQALRLQGAQERLPGLVDGTTRTSRDNIGPA
jgi:hypothetical protein